MMFFMKELKCQSNETSATENKAMVSSTSPISSSAPNLFSTSNPTTTTASLLLTSSYDITKSRLYLNN